MRSLVIAGAAIALTMTGAVGARPEPSGVQVGRMGQAREALGNVDRAVQNLNFSEAEEQQLGADVSAKLRERYGVVQDAAVHRYVSAVGTVVAENSSRADLRWTFIVLDADGVNAFAAPGGFVHVTRGALALMRTEAELAGVLAHEVGHVMARHTIRAIQKAKVEGALANAATRTAFLEQVGNRLYALTLENSFDRGDEMESDKIAAALANQAGYAPSGLGAFLTNLAERNAGLAERSGMFASHPETKARVETLAKIIGDQRLTSTATVAARYSQAVDYPLVPVSQIAQAAPPSATEKPAPAAAGASGKFGLGGLNPLGREKGNEGTIASAGSRGVNPDRDARGGPNKALVVVTLTAAELAEFRQGISG